MQKQDFFQMLKSWWPMKKLTYALEIKDHVIHFSFQL